MTSSVYDALVEKINETEDRRQYLEERYTETGYQQFAAQATRERGRLEGLREARDLVAERDFAEELEASS